MLFPDMGRGGCRCGLSLPSNVVREVGLPVGVLNPSDHPSGGLRQVATFYRTLRPGVLAASQFPDLLRDAVGEFHKPPGW
jgi:hypothetical protein